MDNEGEVSNHEQNRDRVKAQLELLLRVIEQENSLFINIGSLAVALIVVLSLNHDLVSFQPIESKILLSGFLVLTVLTLATHSYMLNGGKKNSVKIIEKIIGKSISNQIPTSYSQKILAYVPRVVLITFSLALLYIVYVLWR